MKTITLLAAVFLLSATTVNASGMVKLTGENNRTRFSIEEPISFTERGIEFFVFPNGEFDFNTAPSTDSGIYYREGRRNNNKTYGAPVNQGVRIEHDALGRIRRIGNVFVNYDAQSRIKRIGSVYMTYNRFALTQIGNLRIMYNHRGQIVNMIGNVKGYSAYQYNDDCDDMFYGNQQNSDDDHVYYRTNGTKVASDKMKKEDKK